MHSALPSNPWRIWDLVGDRRGLSERPPPRLHPEAPLLLPACPTCGHRAPIEEVPQDDALGTS